MQPSQSTCNALHFNEETVDGKGGKHFSLCCGNGKLASLSPKKVDTSASKSPSKHEDKYLIKAQFF